MKTMMYGLLFVCVCSVLMAGDLNPPAAPGPDGTMKTLDEVEPRIPIPGSATATGIFVINDSGSYYLTGNRHSSTFGISVFADDVTIDLCGYSLIGSDAANSYGVYFYNSSNVEVRNGTIRNYHTGAAGTYSTNLNQRVMDLRIHDCTGRGISLPGGNHQVVNCTVSDCGMDGINVGGNSRVQGNTVYNNSTYGIALLLASIAKDNVVYSNGNIGINASHGCTVQGNTVYSNSADGINASDGCIINNNSVRENSGEGIDAGACAMIRDNSAYQNTGYGIKASSGSTISNNSVCTNGLSGIRGYACLIRDNQVSSNNSTDTNGEGGIRVANYCRVIGNSLNANLVSNIYVYSYGNFIESNTMFGGPTTDYGIYFQSNSNYYQDNRTRYTVTAGFGGSLPSGSYDGGGNVSLY